MNEPATGLDDPNRLQRPAPVRQAPLRRPPLGLPAEIGLPGVVERGVDTAYTVIEAYLRRGQQAAQRQSPGAADPGAGPGGLGGSAGLGGFSGLGLPGGLGATLSGALPWGPAASSIAGPWLQLLRAWSDAVATLGPLASRALGPGAGLVPGFPGEAGQGPAAEVHQAANAANAANAASTTAAAPAAAAPAQAPAHGASGPRAKITIELVARGGAEVAVSLEPGADLAALQADWLAPPDGSPATPPGQLQIYSEPGHVHLRLALAKPPPPGRHQAAVIDNQGLAWGSVVVTIAPPGPAYPAAH